MSETKLSLTIRASGSEIFDSVEAPFADTEAQRTLNVGSSTKLTAQQGASSTPVIDQPPVSLEITLGGGVTTIDLTAVAGLAMPPDATRTLDMTGAKLVAAVFQSDPANTGNITIDGAVTTPYPLFGSGKSRILCPGEVEGFGFNGVASAKPAVSGTVKFIGVSSTHSGDVLYADLYFGT